MTADRTRTWPRRAPRVVHPVQVSRAFSGGDGAYVGRLLEHHGSSIIVSATTDGMSHRLLVARPARLRHVLARTDVTRLDGAPLVLVNEGCRVLGVATGPSSVAERLLVR